MNEKYETIKVTIDHIKNAESCNAKYCALAAALNDSNIIKDNESAYVRGADEIFVEYIINNDIQEIPLKVHPKDLDLVRNFINWHDEDDVEYLLDHMRQITENPEIDFKICRLNK